MNINRYQLEIIHTHINELENLIDKKSDISLEELIEKLYIKLDDLFSCEGLECLDWERVSDAINIKYSELINDYSDINDRQKITDVFIKFYEYVMIVNRYTSPDKIYEDIMKNIGMELFFRESMQFVRNAEANYTRFVKNVEFLGIKNAFLFL